MQSPKPILFANGQKSSEPILVSILEVLSGESVLQVKSMVDGILEEMVYVLLSLKLKLSTMTRSELQTDNNDLEQHHHTITL